MDSLNLKVVEVKGTERKDLDAALLELAELDADFCGDNGCEYLWEEAWGEDGPPSEYDSDEDDEEYEEREPLFDSNAEYLLDTLKCESNHKTVIEEFVSKWVGNDSYYNTYELDVKYDSDGKAKIIALAMTY